MTKRDIEKIEFELSIILPSHYVSFVLEFPNVLKIVHDKFEDSTFSQFYDNSDRLIELNNLLRLHWPDKLIKNRFCIGESGCGDYFLINLEDPFDTKVYLFDHEECAETCYDENNDIWHWDRFPQYENINAYEESILMIYGDPEELDNLSKTNPKALEDYLSELKANMR